MLGPGDQSGSGDQSIWCSKGTSKALKVSGVAATIVMGWKNPKGPTVGIGSNSGCHVFRLRLQGRQEIKRE
jgi:hypothetical protein